MKCILGTMLLGLSMVISLNAQPQMPYLNALNGPFSAQNIIDLTLGRYDPVEPPIIYAVNADTCLTKTSNRGDSWTVLPKGHFYKSGIRCAAVHPTVNTTVYKGEWGNTNEKGLMKSTDGGFFWNRINTNLPNYVIPSKLGIFPHTGYYEYLLAGMAIDQQAYGGYSLYRTTNGGTNWLPIAQWNPDFLNITDFTFDPSIPEIVCLSVDQSTDLANALRGVWKSSDFGGTWTHIGRPDNMSYPEVTCLAMVNQSIIFAGFWSGGLGGIEKTTDGGNSWSVLALTSNNPVKDIAIDIQNPSTFYVSFGAFDQEIGNGIVKFDNYGSTWTYYNNGLTDKFVNCIAGHDNDLFVGTSKGFFRRELLPSYIWIEKSEILRSYIDFVYCYSNKIISFGKTLSSYVTGPIAYLVKSTNGGSDWQTVNTFNSFTRAAAVRPDADQEMLRGYSPNNIVGVDRMLAKSTNGGDTWNIINYATQSYEARLSTIKYASVMTSRVYVGMKYVQSSIYFPIYMLRSYNAGTSFTELTDNHEYWTNTIAIASNPDYIYLGDADTRPEPYSPKGVWKSTDAGNSWIEFNNGLPSPPPLINELIIDCEDVFLYAATDQGLWKRAADGPAMWTRIGQDVIPELDVIVVIANPNKANILYCATIDGSSISHLYTSPNHGLIWLEIPIDWSTGDIRIITDLTIEPNAPDTLLVGTSQGVYRYIDNYISGALAQNTTLYGDWIVTGDITVPTNITLTLQPGTRLYSVPNFDECRTGIDINKCELVINGNLYSVGNQVNRIDFTTLATYPEANDWYGIRVLGTGQINLVYSNVSYAYSGLTTSFVQTTNVNACVIQNNGTYGLRLYGSGIAITDNTIDNNGYYGIYITACNGSINGNNITRHGGYGIWINGSVNIEDNTINNEDYMGTSQHGIYFYNGFQNQTMSLNTIKGFGQGGVLIGANNTINIDDCTIFNNHYYGIKRLSGSGNIKLRNSDVLEHETGVFCLDHPPGGMNLGVAPFDPGNNSIYATDFEDFYYVQNVGENSEPALIFAEYNWWGCDPPIPSKFVGPVDYTPWLSGPPIGGPQSSGEISLDNHINLIFPNPLTDKTTIYYTIKESDNVTVHIYNICGQMVKTFARRISKPGSYNIMWDGTDNREKLLATGIYFVQLVTDKGLYGSHKVLIVR